MPQTEEARRLGITGLTCLVVPSIRETSLKRFLHEWDMVGLFDQIDCLCIVEDNPTRTFDVERMGVGKLSCDVEHFSWQQIDAKLGRDSWIVPRRSDTVRSFGYWWAWQDRCREAHSGGPSFQYLMTLDDDCYPAKDYELVANHHRALLGRTRWFNSLSSVRPRGFPYRNVGERDVMVNHGIWQGVLDYDAPQQLVNPIPEVYTHDSRIVPNGAYLPFCGMNWMCQRDAIPLMYHLLMGRLKNPDHGIASGDESLLPLPFDRFGDIWCGILMKRVADHLGWWVSSGTPYIHHDRASDPFKNLRKEANGIEQNETFWERIDAVRLEGTDPAGLYTQLGDAIRGWDGEHAKYWGLLGEAMVIWAGLFRAG